MATAQYGGIITGLRGSIGGMTFSKGGSMQVVKNKAAVPKPVLPQQQAVKQLLARFSPGWQLLSSSDRTDWATYAATCPFVNSLGQTYYLTGFQMYVRCQMAQATRGTVNVIAAPTASGKGTTPTVDFDLSGGDLRCTSIVPGLASGDSLRGAIFFPLKQTIGSPRGRQIGTFEITSATGLPVVLVVGYSGTVGAGVGARAFIQWRVLDQFGRVADLMTSIVDFTG